MSDTQTLAPEDVRKGQLVTVHDATEEYDGRCYCGSPFVVLAVTLPYVRVEWLDGDRYDHDLILDLRLLTFMAWPKKMLSEEQLEAMEGDDGNQAD